MNICSETSYLVWMWETHHTCVTGQLKGVLKSSFGFLVQRTS